VPGALVILVDAGVTWWQLLTGRRPLRADAAGAADGDDGDDVSDAAGRDTRDAA
jgi:hypothetical protein